MQADSIRARVAAGAAAGLAGTLALQPLRSATSSRFPSTDPPIKQPPGQFMVDQAKAALPRWASRRVPESLAKGAAQSIALGYGVTFGAAYALARPKPGNVLLDGAVLGVATWAAGYLGWLPALKLMRPVTRQRPRQVVTPILQHLVFGIVAVAVVSGIAAVAKRSR